MGEAAKRDYLAAIRARYRRAGKHDKGVILDEFCSVCGYHRKYAIRLLNRHQRGRRQRPGPTPVYGSAALIDALRRLWCDAGYLCGKRLKTAIPHWLPFHEKRYGILADEIRALLLGISPATIDRLLRPYRAKARRGIGGTRPGTLLKQQIPVRTTHWDVSGPGFLEADTVAHCGDSMTGDFAWSLNLTDIASGWIETRAVWGKGARGVLKEIKDIEQHLPFPILGFDSDNGTEFLNYHLLRYFTKRQKGKGVEFTRSRPYHKNDNAHVEQKNWTHVRQLVGYDRLDDSRFVALLNDLYANAWNPLTNFFHPVMKLISKERVGAKVIRRYDTPQTPYARLLASPHLAMKAKRKLETKYARLDPFELKEGVKEKLHRIIKLLAATSLVTSNVRQ